MMNFGRGVSATGALMACVGFFLPWVLTSCGTTTMQLSGWQLAFGAEVQTQNGPQAVQPNGLLVIALLCAAATLIVAGVGMIRAVASAGSANALIALALVPLLILALRFGNDIGRAAQPDSTTQILPGFWLTVGGYVLALAGGVISRIRARARPA